MYPPTSKARTDVPPINSERFILFDSTMMNKFKKLVAVAEEMATQWELVSTDVEGIHVSVEGVKGIISLGGVIEYPVYHPDENVYMPEYGLEYTRLEFKWVNDTWERVYPVIRFNDEAMADAFAIEDPLPF